MTIKRIGRSVAECSKKPSQAPFLCVFNCADGLRRGSGEQPGPRRTFSQGQHCPTAKGQRQGKTYRNLKPWRITFRQVGTQAERQRARDEALDLTYQALREMGVFRKARTA